MRGPPRPSLLAAVGVLGALLLPGAARATDPIIQGSMLAMDRRMLEAGLPRNAQVRVRASHRTVAYEGLELWRDGPDFPAQTRVALDVAPHEPLADGTRRGRLVLEPALVPGQRYTLRTALDHHAFYVRDEEDVQAPEAPVLVQTGHEVLSSGPDAEPTLVLRLYPARSAEVVTYTVRAEHGLVAADRSLSDGFLQLPVHCPGEERTSWLPLAQGPQTLQLTATDVAGHTSPVTPVHVDVDCAELLRARAAQGGCGQAQGVAPALALLWLALARRRGRAHVNRDDGGCS